MEDSERPVLHSPEEGTAYPDIDETVQYPWQDNQPPAVQHDSSIHSVLDPRLYSDLFPHGASELSDQPGFDDDYDVDDISSDARDSNMFVNEDENSDGSLYQLSEGDDVTSEGEESEGTPPVEDDDEDFPRRRRRRRATGPFAGRRFGARGGKGIRRGPRRPLEPSMEFKLLHSQATTAFIDGELERAADLVKQAILTNPEIFPAHSLLSEIYLAQGQKDKALTALFSGAHTRPKDPTVWAKVARLIMERADEDGETALNDVIYCYTRMIEIDPSNYNARFQRAAIHRQLGQNGRAAIEYERILNNLPHNTRALQHLAEAYIELNDVEKAIDRYEESVAHYLSLDPAEAPEFSWSDVNIYVELFSFLQQYEEGLKALKSVSRWLLGRKDDTMWEDFDEDDREWDANDSPRRIKTDGYIPHQWPRDSYGLGLPLELRVKLGLFRLKMGYEHRFEALHHFEWLNPGDSSEGARLYDYGDLFREVADALKEFGLFEDALRFYRPLQQTNEYADVSFFMAMGDCTMALGMLEDAEGCYLTVAEHDPNSIESRIQLAKLYESIGLTEQAFKYVSEAVILGKQKPRRRRRRKDTRLAQLTREFKLAEASGETQIPPDMLGAGRPATKREEAEDETQRTGNVQFLYSKLLQLRPMIHEGNLDATEDWLDIADALLRDFQSNRVFYPLQRNMLFLGYSRQAQRKAGNQRNKTLMDEMHDMANRLQESLGTLQVEPLEEAVPTDYHGIAFDDWLDIFLQYALLVTDQDDQEEAYDTLSAAAGACVWYHSKRMMRLIHVCWFTCALRVQDEETLANEARWFIKEYQFVTDTYRLFAMLSHLCGDPHRSLFHSSPNMKFMLRQIKAMDYTLPDDPTRSKQTRESIYKERAALSTRDETTGEAIPAKDMDIALLVLYGHILYSGNSFIPALNYFFRAYALDDENPAVLLSIALCYIHHALKRQSDNRHYLVMQGLSFLHEYRRIRDKRGTLAQERQEMEFNFARVWHMLGLAHLAVEGYHRVLKLGEVIRTEEVQTRDSAMTGTDDQDQVEPAQSPLFLEDFSPEAAMALQNIYALNGDLKAAKVVTEKWLVV